jgi:hypothetical protein
MIAFRRGWSARVGRAVATYTVEGVLVLLCLISIRLLIERISDLPLLDDVGLRRGKSCRLRTAQSSMQIPPLRLPGNSDKHTSHTRGLHLTERSSRAVLSLVSPATALVGYGGDLGCSMKDEAVVYARH